MQEDKVSRTEARAVPCPACGAGAEKPCRGARGKPRQANHRERIDATFKARGGRNAQERTMHLVERLKRGDFGS